MYSPEQQKHFFERSKALLNAPVAENAPAAASEMAELRELVVYHEHKYYVQNDPVLSDYEYDHLFKRLEHYEAQFPELRDPDSPTQRVGNDTVEGAADVVHLTPMLSLGNSYNAEDLKEFDEQIKRILLMEEDAPVAYTVEPKFDGGSIALVYENDRLVRAATRGNGVRGEEMTHNARVIKSIPLRANFKQHGIHRVELRGEVLIRKDVFEKINTEREAVGKSLFANPRNAATGGLRMKDPREAAQRGLVAFIYQIGFAKDAEGNDVLNTIPSHDGSIQMLAELGFKVPTVERKRCENIGEAAAFCTEWEAKRETYAYEIDGMVVKLDSRELQERVGYTSHHPRWAIAYKFAAKQATSKLLAVDYQVGKIGSITPVARIESVALAGVTIANVSLHNEDFIVSKDLRLGDTVLVERAGDVIPYIVKAMDELRDGSERVIEFPTFCPVNDTETPVPLLRAEGEAAWRCPDCVCGKQYRTRIIWHVSKQAMDIDGLGERQVHTFADQGWLDDIADVYRLPYDEILALPGYKEKSVNNLRDAIERAKQNPIYRLLHSLSIHHLGKKASKLLAAEIEHVLNLRGWTLEDFTNIKDIGPKVAENVMAWFANPHNVAQLQEMEALGVNLRQTERDRPVVVRADAPLAGKSILFTGTLTQMSRKEAQQRAVAAGARTVSAVSGKLDILVAGEKAGSKLKKAQALGTVTVWSEEEFLQQLQS